MNPQDQNPIQTTPTEVVIPTTPKPKIGKFRASFLLAKESWGVLKQDKELVWFPILSSISSIVALIALAALVFFVAVQGDMSTMKYLSDTQRNIVGYAGLFIYYIVMFCITNYFLAGLYTVVHARFNGKNLSVSDGIAQANANIGKIFVWSLISATVGVILRIISDKSAFIGKIIAGLLGAAWGILTYFSLPSLVIGQKTVKESFKDSAELIRKTWGEVLIMNFGMGIFFALVFFMYSALSIGVIVLIPLIEVFIGVGLLYVLFILAFVVVLSTLEAIFKLALYEYAATGKVPQGFTPELIEGAVKRG